jgi:hypothetical protein
MDGSDGRWSDAALSSQRRAMRRAQMHRRRSTKGATDNAGFATRKLRDGEARIGCDGALYHGRVAVSS